MVLDVIYLDYQKAIDIVPIKRLMQKLKRLWSERSSSKMARRSINREENESRCERIILLNGLMLQGGVPKGQ